MWHKRKLLPTLQHTFHSCALIGWWLLIESQTQSDQSMWERERERFLSKIQFRKSLEKATWWRYRSETNRRWRWWTQSIILLKMENRKEICVQMLGIPMCLVVCLQRFLSWCGRSLDFRRGKLHCTVCEKSSLVSPLYISPADFGYISSKIWTSLLLQSRVVNNLYKLALQQHLESLSRSFPEADCKLWKMFPGFLPFLWINLNPWPLWTLD